MAVINRQIQTDITKYSQPRVVRDSAGKLYTVYKKVTNTNLWVAYSTDSGLNWTEVDSGVVASFPTLATSNEIPFHYILSRPHDCNTADGILKAQQISDLLKKLKIPKGKVQMWDDNPSVISAITQIGVKCHDARKFNHK